MAFATDPALERLFHDLRNNVTGASRKSLWDHNRAQMEHLRDQCTNIKDSLSKSPPNDRTLPSLDPIINRMDSLDRLLQGGDLASWSQMIETHCELERIETNLFQLFDYNGTASVKDRRSAMIKDLKRCVHSIDDKLKKICDKHGQRKSGCNAALWELLAPEYIPSDSVGSKKEPKIVPYKAEYDNDLWLMLQDVCHTFPQPSNLQSTQPRSNRWNNLFDNSNNLTQLRDNLLTSLSRLKRLATEHQNQTVSAVQNFLVLRKLGSRGFIMVFVRDTAEDPGITKRIGHLKHRYVCYNRGATENHVKCYDLPSQDHDGAGACIYTPLLGRVDIHQRTSLVLVDEGAEFFIAVVVGQKDGIALLFEDHIVQQVIEERYPHSPPMEVRQLKQQDNLCNISCRDFEKFASTIKYKHYLDVYYRRPR